MRSFGEDAQASGQNADQKLETREPDSGDQRA